MSYKTTLSSCSKSLTEKKIPTIKCSQNKNYSLKEDFYLLSQNQQYHLDYFLITQNNLKKYSTTKRKYNIYIINSIIFDQRIHKVAVFKNNLLWDESSEFLKRFYKIRESIERIPKISEYYEKYTLFPPVYFGLEGLIIIIMNKWTKRKKNYLEYVEDHEEEREEKKKKVKNLNFEPLINPSLFDNITASKSIVSKNTLDLSKFENETNKNIINTNKNNINNNINNFIKAIGNDIKDKNQDNINSLSFSEIIDDLSSQYSIIINNEINNNNIINDKVKDKKFKKKAIKKNFKKEGRNEIYINRDRNKYYYNTCNNSKINNMTKTSKTKTTTINSPRKKIKISLNKNNNKFIMINNNINIIKRNKNSLPLPYENKSYQKKIMKTENKSNKTKDFPYIGIFKKNSIKGSIKVNTISKYIIEKNQIIKDNNLLAKDNKLLPIKKLNSNIIKNSFPKNPINIHNKKKSNNTINNLTLNSREKNLVNKYYNSNNILKLKNYVQIKRKISSDVSDIFNSNRNHNPLTYRNNYNQQLYSLNEKSNVTLNNKFNSINNENKNIINTKYIKDNDKNNKKIYLEDPFIYKMEQLSKKKQISLTTTNSLKKIKGNKNLHNYDINSLIERNHNINYNFNTNKINKRKNLVLTKLNSKKNIIYNKKSKLLGEDIFRNNSASMRKNSDTKIANHSFKPNTNNNSKNINFNLNLNINFNIDMEKKNKGKKILINDKIINQLKSKMNKNDKYSNIIKNQKINYQYSLTTRNSLRHLKDINQSNKCEYTILKNIK